MNGVHKITQRKLLNEFYFFFYSLWHLLVFKININYKIKIIIVLKQISLFVDKYLEYNNIILNNTCIN